MDLQTVQAVVDSWPVEDQLRLMEAIWDRLDNPGEELELTEELNAKLDRRLAAPGANPGDVITWDEIKFYVRRSR